MSTNTIGSVQLEQQVKFIGSPAYLRGMVGKVIYISQMQPEVCKVMFANGKVVVTDVFQLTAPDEVSNVSTSK